MSMALARDKSSWISVSVFKPRPSFSTEEVVSRLSLFCTSLRQFGFVKSAVFKSLSNSSSAWVVVYSIWENGTAPGAPHINAPEVDIYGEAVYSVAQPVEVHCYEAHCWDCKDSSSIPQLSQGDIVHLRAIVGEIESEDLLSYSCLAILRSYFQRVEGLLSCSFYKSLNGPRMTGLGVWQNEQAAYDFFSTPNGTPGECYWRSLGVKLRFGIYEVAFVTAD